MKKFLCMLCAVAFLGFASLCWASSKPKVTIYTSMYEDVIDAMSDLMKKRFPNYDIEFFYGGTGALQAKIAAEREAKKLGCDMLMVADPSYALELKELGLLHPYLSKEAQNLALEYDAEGYWYPVRTCIMVLAYNAEKTKKEDLPQSFRDFAASASLKGSISMPNPLTSGTALAAVAALTRAYGNSYLDELAQNRVMVESGSVALTKLETGECREIMILEESVLKKREEEQSALQVLYPTDGVITIPSPIMTIKEEWSAHGNTKICEELTDFFLSAEGQRALVKGWMHSVVKNPPAIPYDSRPTAELFAKTLPVDWAKCKSERSALRKQFEERVKTQKK